MSQQDKLSGEPSARFDPQSLLTTPIGLSTPFFFAIYSAASVGAAFWWMSQLTRYTHLEAEMATAVDAPQPVLEVAPMTEPELSVEEPVSVIAAEAETASAKSKPAAKPRVRKAKATA
jgi:hypothetical protein